jgi:hypothetical protein
LLVPLPPGAPGGALGLVLERSRLLCLARYTKEAFSPDAYQQVVAKWGMALSPSQMSVFAALWEWRDRTCRTEDEGVGYVLPKAQLVALVQVMPGGCACSRVGWLLGGSAGGCRQAGACPCACASAAPAPLHAYLPC